MTPDPCTCHLLPYCDACGRPDQRRSAAATTRHWAAMRPKPLIGFRRLSEEDLRQLVDEADLRRGSRVA